MTFTMSRFLGLLAAVLFVLAAFNVASPIGLVPLGLFFLTASFLVP